MTGTKSLFFAVLMSAALMGCRFSYSGTSSTEDEVPDMVDEQDDDDALPSTR